MQVSRYAHASAVVCVSRRSPVDRCRWWALARPSRTSCSQSVSATKFFGDVAGSVAPVFLDVLAGVSVVIVAVVLVVILRMFLAMVLVIVLALVPVVWRTQPSPHEMQAPSGPGWSIADLLGEFWRHGLNESSSSSPAMV